MCSWKGAWPDHTRRRRTIQACIDSILSLVEVKLKTICYIIKSGLLVLEHMICTCDILAWFQRYRRFSKRTAYHNSLSIRPPISLPSMINWGYCEPLGDWALKAHISRSFTDRLLHMCNVFQIAPYNTSLFFKKNLLCLLLFFLELW